MRGSDGAGGSPFGHADPDQRIPVRHPLRKFQQVVNDALIHLNGEFDRLSAPGGRPPIAPERLIRANLLQILFSIRSERQPMEQMRYSLFFRWFAGLGPEADGFQQEPRPAADDREVAQGDGRNPRGTRRGTAFAG